MKQREAEKIKALRESLAKQRKNLDEIEKHIDQIESDAGLNEKKWRDEFPWRKHLFAGLYPFEVVFF